MPTSRLRLDSQLLVPELAPTDGAFVLDRDWRVIDLNECAAAHIGTSPQDAVGERLWDLVPDLIGTECEQNYRESMDRRVVKEFIGRSAAREDCWVESRTFPIPGGLAVHLRDVTERRQLEERLRSREELLSAFFNQSMAGFAQVDLTGRFELVNTRYCEVTGYSEAELFSRRMQDITHPDDSSHNEALFAEAVRTGRNYEIEKRYVRPDGSSVWVSNSVSVIRRASGEPLGLLAVVVDITDKRRVEEEVRASEARLRFMSSLDEALKASCEAPEAMLAAAEKLATYIDASRCAYADVDPDNDRFVIRSDYVSPGITSSAGTYSLDLFGSRAAHELRHGRTLVVRDMDELAPEDGREMFLSIGVQAIICCPLVKDGRLVAMMAVHQDRPRDWTEAEISLVEAVVERCWANVQRVAAEARLRDSEEKFHAIANSIDQMVWSTRPDGFHDYYNERWYEYTGVPRGSTDGEEWNGTFHPDDQQRAWVVWRHSLETGEPYHIEYRLRHRSGQYRWVLGRAQCVRDDQGQITRWFGTCTDIQEIIEARELLSHSREQLEQEVEQRTRERNRAWEMSGDLFAIMDFEGNLRAINPAWSATLGFDQETLLSRSADLQLHPDDQEPLRQVLDRLGHGEAITDFENRLQHKDGSWRWIAWNLVPEGEVFYAVGRDVTAQRETASELQAAQEALRQSQKMEAMGQLTGGVAHDFNNLLSPIIGGLDMLQRRGIGDERAQRTITGALTSAERAKTLVQRLLAFARRQPLQPTAISLDKLVRGMADLVDSTTGPQVRVSINLPDSLPPAIGDTNQLEMALLNLSVNARDAMPDGGTITIAAASERIGKSHSSGLRTGDYVRLSVSDTGIGMDQATLKRAIEPFFSTKGVGKGTGLGLSMVHGLAAQLGGAMTISSRPGLGTRVDLWLPEAKQVSITSDIPDRDEPISAFGLVLLVDDEELVRSSSAEMLAELGYTVVEASDAEEAITLVEAGLRPDLLVTDHLMPGMTGVELARRLKQRFPRLRALIVSGYAEAEGLAPDLPRLEKPFRAAELAHMLAEADSPVH